MSLVTSTTGLSGGSGLSVLSGLAAGGGLTLLLSTASSGATALLAGETQGLALDFTDDFYAATTGFYGSARVIDTGTPANNYNSSPTTTAASLLTMTSPSLKWTIGPNGLGRFQAHNLILQSEDFTTTWTNNNTSDSANTIAAPDGTTTADTVLETATTSTHTVHQSVASLVAGASYSVSCRVRGLNRTRCVLVAQNAAAANGVYAVYDLAGAQVGVAPTVFGAGYSAATAAASITSLGNSWYLCTLTFVCVDATTRFDIGGDSGSGAAALSNNYAGNTSNGLYLWGAHLRRTPSDSTYLATTTAARYALPLEWSSAGILQGLLVEESRTNLCLYSDDLTQSNWAKTGTTAAKTATGPDGVANSASTLTASAANGVAYQAITSASAARSTSLYLKRRTGSGSVTFTQGGTTGSDLVTNGQFGTDISGWTAFGTTTLSHTGSALLATNSSTTGNRGAEATISGLTAGKLYRASATLTAKTGTISAFLNTVQGASPFTAFNSTVITAAGTLYVTFVANATTHTIRLRDNGSDATSTLTWDNVTCFECVETTASVTSEWARYSVTNETITDPTLFIKLATSGDAVDVALVDHEVGAFVTSPIPTLGSTVTRAVDNISLATSAFPYGTDHTWFVWASQGSRPNGTYAALGTNSANIEMRQPNTSNTGLAGVGADLFATGTAASGTWASGKLATSWDADDVRTVFNAGAAATDTGTEAAAPTAIYIGSRSGSTIPWNGYIKQVMCLPVRKSEAQLQTLTS